MRLLTTTFVILFTCGVGCSSDSEGGTSTSTTENFIGSCDTRTVAGGSMGQCRDWVGSSAADLSVSCDGLNGTFSTTQRCPTEGRVGGCAVGPTLGSTAQYGYYAPQYTEATAKGNCDGLSGVFSTGSGGGGAGGAGGTVGAGGASTGGGAGSSPCPPECLRAYECVTTCGDTPVNNGCCPCPAGKIDAITCTRGT
jgi:hypothetical protein